MARDAEMDVSAVELALPTSTSTQGFASPAPSIRPAEADLPPVDRGRQAWLFLAACVAVEMLVWGFPFAFGILHAAYEAGPFKNSTDIAAIGTTASGVLYLNAPIAFGTFQSLPRRYQRFWPVTGVLVISAAIIASSFAQTVPELIITQGLMYALGGGMIYTPCICYVDEWFEERKGLAFGLMYAGTGMGGVVLPLSLSAALSRFSIHTVLLGYGVALFVVLCPLIFFIRPRLPASLHRPRRLNLSFLRSWTFALHQLGNIIQGLGFFLPTIFLPTYVENLGRPSSLGTVAVVLFNVASVAGCIALGYLIDVWSVHKCIALASTLATLSVFILWGIGNSLPVIYVFALLYGLSAGGFSSTWPGTMRLVLRKRTQGTPTMVLGFLAAGRGLGNVVSGPISGPLLAGRAQVGDVVPKSGYASAYGNMIVFTGVTALLGGIAVLQPLVLWGIGKLRGGDEGRKQDFNTTRSSSTVTMPVDGAYEGGLPESVNSSKVHLQGGAAAVGGGGDGDGAGGVSSPLKQYRSDATLCTVAEMV